MPEVENSLAVLKDNGFKLTDKREELLRILSDEDRFISAKLIYEEMIKQYPTMSLDTIYRNLKTFSDLDLVVETDLEGERLFRFNACEHDHHHHHFICENCGRTEEVDLCPMDFFENQLPGAKIMSHRFEIFGLCSGCNQAS